MNLLKYNRHWEKGFKYPFPKERAIFEQLLRHLPKRQATQLVGLRRTGKTVLLFQIINHLLSKEVNSFSIWYFTFDEERPSLENLLSEFSQQTEVDYKKEKIFIFLDEIQKLANFQNQLKIFYDLYPNLKFFISGSTSLFVKKKTQESLAGRVTSFFLPPLSFGEYLDFKEKNEILGNPKIYESEIEKEFEAFLETQFIESLGMKEKGERREYFISIMKKIVFEDMPQVFPIENPEFLWRIIQIVGQHPGLLVNYQDLSRELGISNKTLSSYFYYLEESYLVKKVFNFSRNLLTSQKKLKKYYLASPSFSLSLAEFVDQGKLVENLVISLKDYQFFWRDSTKHEVDFVEVKNGKIIPIEVKYRSQVLAKELKNLLLFARKFKTSRAVVLKKGVTKSKKEVNGIEVEEIPIFFFA